MEPQIIPITVPDTVSVQNHRKKSGVLGKMFKVKRRASQAIREKIGLDSKGSTSNLDADVGYMTLYNELLQTEKDFDALGASFGKFASNLQTWTLASRRLATGCETFFDQVQTSEGQLVSRKSNATNNSKEVVDPAFMATTRSFRRAANEVDQGIRRHVSKEYIDHVIGPLKKVVVDQIPLLKEQHLERHGFATDVASYRRRIVAQRKKQVKDPGNEKRNELLVTLENKLVAAEANFKSVDVVLRREMQWVIDNKHNLVHKQMVMCMCCYSEFYKRANAEFVNVVQNIPEEYRNDAFSTIAQSFAAGPLAPVDQRGAGEKLFAKVEQTMAKTGKEMKASAEMAKQKREEKRKIMLNNQKVRDDMVNKRTSSSANNAKAADEYTSILRPALKKPGFVDRHRRSGSGGSEGRGGSNNSANSAIPGPPPKRLSGSKSTGIHSGSGARTVPGAPPRRMSGSKATGIHLANPLNQGGGVTMPPQRKTPTRTKVVKAPVVPATRRMERPGTPPSDLSDDEEEEEEEEEEDEEEEEAIRALHMEEMEEDAMTMEVAENGGSLRKGIAQYDYVPAEEGELQFYKSQVVVVTAEDESGWGMGYVEGVPGTRGVFPLNYIS